MPGITARPVLATALAGMARDGKIAEMKKEELLARLRDLGEPSPPTWTCIELRAKCRSLVGKEKKEDRLKGMTGMKKQELKELADQVGAKYSEHSTRADLMQRIRQKVTEGRPATPWCLMGFGKHGDLPYSRVFVQCPEYVKWVCEEYDGKMEVGDQSSSPELRRFRLWVQTASADEKNEWDHVQKLEGDGGSGAASVASSSKGAAKPTWQRRTRRARSSSPELEKPQYEEKDIVGALGKIMGSVEKLAKEVQELKADKAKDDGTASSGWSEVGRTPPASPVKTQ